MEAKLHPCRYCGAPGVNYNEAHDGVVKCHYCGGVNDVPGTRISEELAFALNNADNELINCRFEEARESYSKVISLAPKDPQGYIGRALAKFKIKYIKDETCSTKDNAVYRPICYGVTERHFTEDEDYLKALGFGTRTQRALYAKQAEEIDTITDNFYQLKERGLDYDVFICCKVTDDATKQKTADAYDAQRIYVSLQSKGFKPFFSEMDMGDFTGAEYEAVILYALCTSRSMLIVCSNEDYLDTPWVKNEYSRYLTMIENGYKAEDSLTLVYKGTPIEQLPNGKRLPAIDRDGFGASDRIADLVRAQCAPSQPATKFCLNCGAEVDGSIKFCPQCACGEFAATYDEFLREQAQYKARKEQAEREPEPEPEEQDDEIEALRRQLAEVQSRNAAAAKAASSDERYLKFESDGDSCTVVGHADTMPEKLTIPATYQGMPVTAIGEEALAECYGIQTVVISEGITDIGDYAFADSPDIVSVTIPSSVTSIGDGAFSGCLSLEAAKIPSGVKVLRKNTFEGCSSLTSVELPDGLINVGDYAFSGCDSLSTVKLPFSITSIDDHAFYECYNLTSLTLPPRIASIGECFCMNCEKLSAIDIPKGVMTIGGLAFYGCRRITSIVIPRSVQDIGVGAFAEMDSLRTVSIPLKLAEPNGVLLPGGDKLGEYFGDCSRIKFTLT